MGGEGTVLVGALAGAIEAARHELGPLDPVTVVTPSVYSSFYLRRALAPSGLFNVRFMRLEDLAEAIAGQGDRPPLSHLIASELVYLVATGTESRIPQLEAVRRHPSFHESLHRTFIELETAPSQVVEAVGAADPLRGEIARMYRVYEAKATAYERRPELVARAVSKLRGGARLEGRVVLTSLEPPPPAYRAFHAALAALPGSVIMPARASDPVYESCRCVNVPDVPGEVGYVVRDVIARGGQTPFSRTAVFYSDPAYGRRLEEAFTLAEVPVSGPDTTPLVERPEGRFLDLALDAVAGDQETGYARKAVIDWLATTPVRPPGRRSEFHASRWDAVSRNAGIIRGYESWRARLESYANRQRGQAERRLDLGEIDETAARALAAEAAEATTLRAFIEDLGASARPPGILTWASGAAWARGLVERYLDGDAVGAEAVDRILSLLHNLAALDEAGGAPPDLARFVAVVRRELSQTTGGGRTLGAGVFVAPLRFAVGTDFDRAYVVGMVEGAYPPAVADDPLLPDSIRSAVDPDRRHLERRQQRQERAWRRYVAALDAGRNRVLLWPRAEPGASRKSLPSRWLVEAARAVTGKPRLQSGDLLTKRLEGIEYAAVQHRELGSIGPDRWSSIHDLDLHSLLVWQAEAGSVGDHFIARLDGGLLGRAVRLDRARRSGGWTEYDGNLSGLDAGGQLGPARRPVSPTSLETWAVCPLKYFLGHTLRLKPPAEAEEAFEIAPLDRGALIHGILQDYFRRVEAEGLTTVEQRRRAMGEVVQAGLALAGAVYVTGRRVMWRLEQERIARDLSEFVDREAEREAGLGTRQTHAELAFGLTPGAPDAVTVQLPGRPPITFRGMIDRVEMSADGQRAVVVDYKTGNDAPYNALKDDPVDRGRRLQLPVYAEAVRARFPGVQDVGAQYWFVSERGSYRLIPGEPLSARDEMLAAVQTITDGIGSGVFIARPGKRGQPAFENCQICPFDRLCSSGRERHWEQKSADPRLAQYRALIGGQVEDRE